MNRQLYKSSALVGAITLLSRLMGFARDMLIAGLFGVTPATDAFFVAFKIPNFLRRLLAEGAFAHAFVPVLLDYRRKTDGEGLKRFIEHIASVLFVWSAGITLLGMLAAPLLIGLFAPGFWNDAEHYPLAVDMLRITFPYLACVSMLALFGAVLNVHGRFAVPAATPLLLNAGMIASAFGLAPYCAEPVAALAWGVCIAGGLQIAFQAPALWRLKLWPAWRWGWREAGVRRVMGGMLPALFGVSVLQVNLLVDTIVASFLPAGSVSWLYYSDRLVEFPLGVLGGALGTVILPNLSGKHVAEDAEGFSAALDWGLRLVLLAGLPATLGLVLLAQPILFTLFQYNEFGAQDAAMAGRSLAAFAGGLLGFLALKVLVAGFSARQDSRTPVRLGLYAMLANAVLAAVLAEPLAHAGVALATALSAYLQAGLLWLALLKGRVYRPAAGWRLFTLRVLFASASMACGLYYGIDGLPWRDLAASSRALQLLWAIGLAASAYVACLWLLGLRWRHLSAARAS